MSSAIAERLRALPPARTGRLWRARDAILYAVATGVADQPDDESLRLLWERRLRPLPSFVTILTGRAALATADLGLARRSSMHAEQEVLWHAPIPRRTNAVGRIVEVREGDGFLLVRAETMLSDACRDDAPVATLRRTTYFRRSDVPLGASRQDRASQAPPQARSEPLLVPWNSAVLYRLCGDRNPLHIDPATAIAAGFPAPPLHGLRTYGAICWRLIRRQGTAWDPVPIRRLKLRFAAPVFPGDTLALLDWPHDGDTCFELVRVADGSVLAFGTAELAHP
jgi:hypothetical protein